MPPQSLDQIEGEEEDGYEDEVVANRMTPVDSVVQDAKLEVDEEIDIMTDYGPFKRVEDEEQE